MKSIILKFLAPIFIAACSAVVAHAGSSGLIAAVDIPELTAKANEVANGAAIIAAYVVAVGVEKLRAKYFPSVGNSNGSSGASGGMVPLLLLGTAAVIMTGLPSCASGAGIPISTTVRYRDPNTGAKAVIVIGNPVRPLFNGTTGEPLGRNSAPVDLTSGK